MQRGKLQTDCRLVEPVGTACCVVFSVPVARYKNENNRCFGMCAITSLIINDYFGGDICKIYVGGISHYFNLIENNIVDLTKDQFNREMDYKDYKIMDGEKVINCGLI